MASLRMEGIFVSGSYENSLSPLNSVAAHHLSAAVGLSRPVRLKGLVSSFSGQRLAREPSSHSGFRRRRRNMAVVAHGHGHGHGSIPVPTPPVKPVPAETDMYILDDMSRYLYRKVQSALAPHLPADFDMFRWLPDSLHNRLHKGEVVAIFFLREILHFGFFYFLFDRVDAFCKFLNWIYVSKTLHKEVTDEGFESSVFRAMTGPMRFVVLIWAGTRVCHIGAKVLSFDFGPGITSKVRSIGLIVAAAWFFFNWKGLYVEHLAATNKFDAPRIFAFDKVVSLLMYYVAASLIGEVTGFALRSLLAVGGFSGIALGLAAKEIVSNFFGGTLLFITRPFVIGERIKAGQCSGYVQDIGFLQTKILSIERVPMVVPNQNFINQVITNYSRASNRLMEAEFPVRQQDIFLVDRITSHVVKYLRSHPDVDVSKSTPVCYLKSVDSLGIVIVTSCVLRPAGGSEFYRVQQSILVHVAQIIISEGASLGMNSPFGSVIPSLDGTGALDRENASGIVVLD